MNSLAFNGNHFSCNNVTYVAKASSQGVVKQLPRMDKKGAKLLIPIYRKINLNGILY